MKKLWRCHVCNDIHLGNKPPEVCPTCGAKHAFVLSDLGEAMEIIGRDHPAIGEPVNVVAAWKQFSDQSPTVRLTDKADEVELLSKGVVENLANKLTGMQAIDERRAPFEAARWTFKPKPGQVIRQVWFCGAHSDVGGGYPPGEWGLSDIALSWMCDRAREAGLEVDTRLDTAYPMRPDPHGILHNSKTGLYRLTAGNDRVIGKAADTKSQPDEDTPQVDPTQSVHASVLQRWDEDPDDEPRGPSPEL